MLTQSIRDVINNVANFRGKHLCWSFFLIKLQAWGSFLKNIYKQLLLTIAEVLKPKTFCKVIRDVYSEPCQTSKMKCFKPLTIFAKSSILDVLQGSEYISGHYDVWQKLKSSWNKSSKTLQKKNRQKGK